MCGLAGVLGDLTAAHKDAFRDLMDVAQVRGRHSAGVVAITQKNQYRWAKEVGPPAFLFDTKRYEEATGGLLSGMIGHCRAKTVGEVNRANAHPFDFPDDGICGVHNGTLRWYTHLDGYHRDKVDSEVLYEHLAKNGPEKTFNNIEGAWASVWWNDQNNTINFIRNSERPLWFCWTKDSKAMFWASELWMLYAVERRFDLHVGDDEKNPKKFFSLPTDTLWSFEVTPNAKDKKVIFKQPIKIAPKEVRGQQGNSKGTTSSVSSGKWKWNPITKVSERIPEHTGGEVINPFQAKAPKGQDSLDDPLPPLGKQGCTPEGKTNTGLSGVSFLHSSCKKEDTSTEPKNSTKPVQNFPSLPLPTSTATPLTDRKKLTVASNQSSVKQGTIFKNILPPTSIRIVAGQWYITDNKRRKEYREDEFEKNTGAVCSFCRSPVGGLEHVHEFISETDFVCSACVVSPKIPENFERII